MVKTPKSKRFRKVFKKVPGNKVKVHLCRTKPARAKCAECGIILHGVPRARSYKMRNTAKTKKRPQRPNGGVLCSACSRKKIIAKARQ